MYLRIKFTFGHGSINKNQYLFSDNRQYYLYSRGQSKELILNFNNAIGENVDLRAKFSDYNILENETILVEAIYSKNKKFAGLFVNRRLTDYALVSEPILNTDPRIFSVGKRDNVGDSYFSGSIQSMEVFSVAPEVLFSAGNQNFNVEPVRISDIKLGSGKKILVTLSSVEDNLVESFRLTVVKR